MKVNLLAICFCMLLFQACKEEGRLDFVDPNLPAPMQVSDVKMTSLPGAVQLTYAIPADKNLASVYARYEIRAGVFREAKSSIFKDTIKLVGFGDMDEHRVELYSIGRNQKKSEPIVLHVKGLKPPVQTAFESLELIEAFGGVSVSFKNESQENLAIYLLMDTTGNGAWSNIDTFYTGSAGAIFSTRGIPALQKNFAVYIKDRWDNKSDTIRKALVPLFEEEIPKPWTALKMQTDSWEHAVTYTIEKLWDKAYNWSGFASSNNYTLPYHFTIDLRKPALLGRFKVHQFYSPVEHFYFGSALKKFELYGSNNPDADGGWNNWENLGTFESFKPSGLPLKQHSQEDIQYAGIQGEDFEFEVPVGPFRYLRLKALESYSSFGQITIGELSFWGQVKP